MPVGPGHEGELLNVFDSLEAQTFRRWEVICVWDTGNPATSERYKAAFPYVRWLYTDHRGPGYARNRGAEAARGAFVLFLDADDWLYPECLAKMLRIWQEEQAIVYTDYVGKAYIEDRDFLRKAGAEGRVRALLPDNEVVLGHRAFDFDCERVMRQPEVPPYVFCNVTALIPKAWHADIGGFDESMPSWEDVDYHWRMARAGHCYVHLAEELMVYRFYTGGRRDAGLQQHKNLIQYIREKYEREQPVGCNGCGKGRTRTTTNVVTQPRAPLGAAARIATAPAAGGAKVYLTADGRRITLTDDDLVLAQYISEQLGDRPITGPHSRIRYGFHSPGDVFLVHRSDLASPQFQEVRIEPAVAVPTVTTSTPLPPPPPAVDAARPALHVVAPPDIAQTAEEGGLPDALQYAANEAVPVDPPETQQFMEPSRLSVRQIAALLERPSTSSAMVRAMLNEERAGDEPRQSVVTMLERDLRRREAERK